MTQNEKTHEPFFCVWVFVCVVCVWERDQRLSASAAFQTVKTSLDSCLCSQWTFQSSLKHSVYTCKQTRRSILAPTQIQTSVQSQCWYDGFRITGVFLKNINRHQRTCQHFKCHPLISYKLKMHCQHANTTVTLSMVSLSAGDTSKINDVHSINLMDKMSERLWMGVHIASLSLSHYVYVPGCVCVCLRPTVETEGEAWPFYSTLCPEQNQVNRDRWLVSWNDAALSHTGKKRRGKKEKILAFH